MRTLRRRTRRPARSLVGRLTTERNRFETGFGGANPFPQSHLASRGFNEPGDDGDGFNYPVAREPTLFKLPNGTWAAMWSGQVGTNDFNGKRIYAATSADKGKTWSSPIIVYNYAAYNGTTAWLRFGGAGCDSNGRVHVHFNKMVGVASVLSSMSQWYIYSDDLSLTSGWSTEANISSAINPDGYTYFIADGQIFELKGGAQAGYLVAGGYRRSTIAGTSYALLVYSADKGATWARGGRVEAVAANDNTNETTACEIGVSGRVYMNSRINGANGRRHGIVTDVTTDPITSYTAMTDGTNDIDSQNCNGCAVSAPNGDLYVSAVTVKSSGERGRLACFYSDDAKDPATTDPTFPTSRVLDYGRGGYSALGYLGRNELLGLYENSKNVEQESVDLGLEFLGLCRFSRKWLKSSLAKKPVVVEYHFNDMASGAVSQIDSPLRDHGTHNLPGQTKNVTGGTWNSADTGSIDLVNSPGIILESDQTVAAAQQHNAGWDWENESWTLKLRISIDTDDGADRVILDDRNGVTTAAGYTLRWDTGDGELIFEWNDAVAGNQVLSTSNSVPIGTRPFTLCITRDVVAGTMTMQHDGHVTTGSKDDGVFVGPAAASDPTGNVVALLAATLGSQVNGLLPFDGSLFYLKMIKGQAVPLSGSVVSVPKVSPLILAGNRHVVPSLPASYSDCIMAVGQMWTGGDLGADFYGARDYGRMPPVAGQGIGSMRDAKNPDRLFRTISDSRAAWFEYSDKAGWLIRIRGNATATTHFRRSDPTDGTALVSSVYDIAQNTGIFSFGIVVEFLEIGTAQCLWSNKTSSSTTAGHMLLKRSADNFLFYLNSTAGNLLVESNYGPTIVANTPYYIGVSVNGEGDNAHLFIGTFGAGLTPPADLTEYTTTGTVPSLAAGPWAAADPWVIGAAGDETTFSAPAMRWKQHLGFNVSLSKAQHIEWAAIAPQF